MFSRYYAALCSKAYKRIPFTPLVEEIVQDVFVNLWQKASGLDANGNVKAYLYATMRNKILFELRTEANRELFLNKMSRNTIQKAEENELEKMYAKETEEEIYQLISSLPSQCKEAFMLSRFEQLSYKAIAHRMGISVNTVEKHVAKALKILRDKLGKWEGAAFVLLVWILLSNMPRF